MLTSLLYFDLFDVTVTSSIFCSNVLCADALLKINIANTVNSLVILIFIFFTIGF